MTEKTLTSRQLKRREWWSKKSDESDGLPKEAGNQISNPDKKRKLKHVDSEHKAKKSKTEILGNADSSSNDRIAAAKETDHDNSSPVNESTGNSAKSKRKQKKATNADKLYSGDLTVPVTSKQKEKKPAKTKKSVKAYVLFVGNLNYSTTKEDLEKHFESTGGVKAVRLLTDKDTERSRGCAYVELVDSKAHKRGLLLHESELDGRKINVEFTSRGRKTEKRTEWLKKKNSLRMKMKRPFGPASDNRA